MKLISRKTHFKLLHFTFLNKYENKKFAYILGRMGYILQQIFTTISVVFYPINVFVVGKNRTTNLLITLLSNSFLKHQVIFISYNI
jgi:hypothetical protein